MFQNKHTKNKLVFSGAILCLVLTGYAGIFYWTKIIKTEHRKVSTEAGLAESNKSRLDEIKNIMERTKDIRAKIEKNYILPKDGIVKFIEEVEDLGREAGVTVSINVDNAPTENTSEKWEKLNVLVLSEGSWSANYHFLSMLEVLPHQTSIKKTALNFAPADKDEKNSKSLWKGEFEFDVLKFK